MSHQHHFLPTEEFGPELLDLSALTGLELCKRRREIG